MTSIYAYIVNWDESEPWVLDTESQFLALSQPYTVINSGKEKTKPNWLNVGDIRYYRQFLTAAENFDTSYEYMLFMCGDIIHNSWKEVLDKAHTTLSETTPGVYSFYSTHESWDREASRLDAYADNHRVDIAINSEGLCMFIHRDVVASMKAFLEHLYTQVSKNSILSGWGLDLTCCYMANKQSKLVLRDTSYLVDHANPYTSYSKMLAEEEAVIFYKEFIKYCDDPKDFVDYICKAETMHAVSLAKRTRTLQKNTYVNTLKGLLQD